MVDSIAPIWCSLEPGSSSGAHLDSEVLAYLLQIAMPLESKLAE